MDAAEGIVLLSLFESRKISVLREPKMSGQRVGSTPGNGTARIRSMGAGGTGARGVALAVARNDGGVGDGVGGRNGAGREPRVKGPGEMVPVRPGELADPADGSLLDDLPDDEQGVRVNTESAEEFIREK